MTIQEKFLNNSFFDDLKFNGEELTEFLFTNNIGLLIILDFIIAKDWPFYGKKLCNEPTQNIPLIWALFHSEDGKSIEVSFEIHPTKCFPNLYKNNNKNHLNFPIPIISGSGGTLGGCYRNSVNLNGRTYNVKAPEYCSIFGIPDDCYDSFYENRMLELLSTKKGIEIWCYEKTDYIKNNIDPYINIKYMKGEFLPAKYFLYVDTSINFLKGIFKNKELESLNQNYWYFNGKEYIDERNLDEIEDEFRFEDNAINRIINTLLFEFLRQLLLLLNKAKFKNFNPTNFPQLNLENYDLIKKNIIEIIQPMKREAKAELETILRNHERTINKTLFNSSRFMVMDVEYTHVVYPIDSENRSFNFPCIFSSISWEGKSEGLKNNIIPLILPCHFCKDDCESFKKNNLKFECLVFARDFIDQQVSMIEEMLGKYENFKIYSFGKSDILQLEHSDNFFSDKFEPRVYLRRNRKRAKRISKISFDINDKSKRLKDIENEYLKKWMPGWSRKSEHKNVNQRFMTKCESMNWKINYDESLRVCLDDTISAFLYLLYKNYKIEPEKTKSNTIKSLDDF
ncbi:MAG: hypothetical protein O8C64_01100 [Candidatus Methanoperedens sp.]|nr:hypothetical protein [Candidatus Methanoperedens sp.]MCZ7404766.1 hypothetical protein [Candidatus Methanoperedens sp.]